MGLVTQEIRASGYRSLRSIRFPTARLTVFIGANGVGKTNLYRALQLLQAAAAGTLARELAAEGGMNSVYWAGKRTVKQPVQVRLMASLAGDDGVGPATTGYSYEVTVGLPMVKDPTLPFEPQIKAEELTVSHGTHSRKFLERRGPLVLARDRDGKRADVEAGLMASETALGSLQDPSRFPDLHLIRRTLLDWRFYHELRTDFASPLRQPCLAVTTPTLSSDGSDLAAVFATLAHIRQDTVPLDRAVEDAFPGAQLMIPLPQQTASFGLVFPDYPQRLFGPNELSDGTLRYLALAGALLGLRLPAFIALNEPETSLHPDLLDPLARLIAEAAQRTQIWLVTHSEPLAAALERHSGVKPRVVIKRNGETWLEGLKLCGGFDDEDE